MLRSDPGNRWTALGKMSRGWIICQLVWFPAVVSPPWPHHSQGQTEGTDAVVEKPLAFHRPPLAVAQRCAVSGAREYTSAGGRSI